MCGIVGIIEPGAQMGVNYARAQKMLFAIRHRGPDANRVIELDNGITFGHARLSIIDLDSRSNQPMVSPSERTTIIYNGELYNYRELRASLLQMGYEFRTNSDTEVLLNSYECWGIDFLNKLNGMFAFAIYDKVESTVLFARDRLGIKPLYYSYAGNKILFGSEIKAVLAGRETSPILDINALAEYLAFQNCYGTDTLVNEVKLFPAGSYSKISLTDPIITPQHYWVAEAKPIHNVSLKEREECLSDLIQSCITEQAEAEVPVSAFLSGGIDSSAIAVIASSRVQDLRTFTCGFDVANVTDAEQLFDERNRAEQIAYLIGSEHYETVLKEDDFINNMNNWAWHAEEPRVGSSFPNFCIARLASKFTKICLSGTGADELFGGYPWRYSAALNTNSDQEFIENYATFWRRMLSRSAYSAVIEPISSMISFDPGYAFSEKVHSSIKRSQASNNPRADAALIFELETFLPGLLLMEDKVSMAHGLEVRVPLLDNRIIDFALSLPFEEKVDFINHTSSNTIYGKGSQSMYAYSNGKRILRSVMKQHVPNDFAMTRKQGFSPPFETWFRKRMHGWIDKVVFGFDSPLRDYLNMDAARLIWEEHSSGKANHRLFIWGMISLNLFIKNFLRS